MPPCYQFLGYDKGMIVGTCGGILSLAYERDRERFLAGTTYGVLIGMIVGPGLLPGLGRFAGTDAEDAQGIRQAG